MYDCWVTCITSGLFSFSIFKFILFYLKIYLYIYIGIILHKCIIAISNLLSVFLLLSSFSFPPKSFLTPNISGKVITSFYSHAYILHKNHHCTYIDIAHMHISLKSIFDVTLQKQDDIRHTLIHLAFSDWFNSNILT